MGRSLVTELDPDAVFNRLLEVARELTGARYAAIGVLDERRERLERFLTAGIPEDVHRAIGDLPRGRGVLGVLITDPKPLRLADVGSHPQSYGFPLAHPAMTTFLGVPLIIEGQAWGNLYLTEKDGGEEFSEEDEQAVVVLADWAAIAIRNARLYRTVRERRDELERTMRGLETTTEISRALGGVTDLGRVLELVVKRSRALIDARAAEISLREGDEYVLAAVAGEHGDDGGDRIVAPMVFRNREVGTLTVIDRLHGDRPFNEEDERLLQAFAASAATAVATAQNASEEALRRSIEASEAERTRWSRELHDDTLQQLAGLRMLLSGARRSGDADRMSGAIEQALEQITTAVGDLRSLITELRPAALDELGITPALESLVARFVRQTDLETELDVAFAEPRFAPEIESTVYRLVQEALTNIAKHARADRVSVRLRDRDGDIDLIVRDDGAGFDPQHRSSGFGLIGMRERLALVNGTLHVESSPGAGTVLRASIPVRRSHAAAVA
ncbi:GAF domain-containing sensor histidine kinase [Solirubrobacter phytolaccae]|uniref:histidine kinase n=1 Tax=Solirubrobacter phytolaccae TaxID=1404360 RepID=A0A9X3NKJ7_9ACTN|nr:GAF domain-containing sensor histidine kinase [Solirubrobacter phytolaccae]MDA0183117.1 GAF domain-containing sensor histidine kinase [Solirubrobacter phytolaccae]